MLSLASEAIKELKGTGLFRLPHLSAVIIPLMTVLTFPFLLESLISPSKDHNPIRSSLSMSSGRL